MTPACLRQRASELETEAQTLVTSIAGENRDATEIEQAEIDRRLSEADRVTRQAEQIESINARIQSRAQPQGRISSPTFEAGESEDDKKIRTGGFQSAGHFFREVTLASNRSVSSSNYQALTAYRDLATRVQQRAATGGNIMVDSEGGDLIPYEYAGTIWDKAREENDIVSRINFTPISGNTMRFPIVGETSRANGSRYGGLASYWDGEAEQFTTSKPKFGTNELRLKKVTVYVPATNELLEDSGGAFASFVQTKVPEEIGFKIQDGVINGTGNGMPMGILQAACLVTQTKESGQASATFVAANWLKMWSRVYAPCRRNAVILFNQDMEPQLAQMTIATGTYSGQLVYMPPTGLSDSPYATLNGRPLIPIPQCPTLGTKGDFIVADFSQMHAIRKSTGIKQDMSIHVRFDYDETVFKFSMRLDVQPAWPTALTPFKGTNTQSPFVCLETR